MCVYENLIKSFQWHKLWLILYQKDVQELTIEEKSILAMLLSSFWLERKLAYQLLESIESKHLSPIGCFARTYAYMALGDEKKTHECMQNITNVLCGKRRHWTKDWLIIEILGRTKQFQKQYKYIKKSFRKGLDKDLCKIAILKSLDYKGANLQYAKRWFKENCENTTPLDKSLYCFLFSDNNTKYLDGDPEYFLFYFSQTKMKKGDVLGAIEGFDLLSRNKFLSHKSCHQWLSLCLSSPQGFEFLEKRVEFVLSLLPKNSQIEKSILHVLLIKAYINLNSKMVYKLLQNCKSFYQQENTKDMEKFKIQKIFFLYILQLYHILGQNQKKLLPRKSSIRSEIYTLGDSHSLALSNINLYLFDKLNIGRTLFVMGVKMFHFLSEDNPYSWCVFEHLKKINETKNSQLMFTIGEIDTRPTEGIWQNSFHKGIHYKEVVDRTVDGYIARLKQALPIMKVLSVIIQGIPAPGYQLEGDKNPGDKHQFLEMVQYTNKRMKIKSLEAGLYFLDVYSATVGTDFRSNGHWHIDGYHLTPMFYTEADKWLISP